MAQQVQHNINSSVGRRRAGRSLMGGRHKIRVPEVLSPLPVLGRPVHQLLRRLPQLQVRPRLLRSWRVCLLRIILTTEIVPSR